MTDDAWYLTELGERAASIDRLTADLQRWKNRVRELEDAISIHRQNRFPNGGDADYLLWDQLDLPWT